MIILAAFLLGLGIGWWRASQRGGTRADKVQYALAHGIPAALLGLILTVLGLNMGWGI